MRRAALPCWRASRARASMIAVVGGFDLRSGFAEGRLSQNTPASATAQTAAMAARCCQRISPERFTPRCYNGKRRLIPGARLQGCAQRGKETVPMAETPHPGATSSIEDQIRLREQKAEQLRERGVNPYGTGVAVPHTTGFVRARHESDDAAALEANRSEEYGLAGRVMALRTMGKATFASLRDRDGDLQVFIKKDKVGDAAYEL